MDEKGLKTIKKWYCWCKSLDLFKGKRYLWGI